MKIWRVFLPLVIIATLILALPVSASPTLREYWNTGGDADSIDIFGANVVAEQFTSSATAHTVTSIRLELLCVLAPPSVKVSLYNAAAGVPTTEITSVTYAGTVLADTYTMTTFDIPDVSLSPSTQYAIVVSCPNGNATNYVQWHQDSGGGLASAVGLHSHDSAISWTSDTPADYLFEIYGDVVFQVKGANVFEDYLVDGDWLITIETINSYPNYTTEDASRYFNVQLLNVAGTAVLAATTLKSWGGAPCAIYLSPTSVIPLTSGSAYIIRMIGTFTGTPSTSYTLQNTASNNDWQGNNLKYLDNWCLKTAKSMHDYDYGVGSLTNPYTTKNSVGGEMLSNNGGGNFIIGIPSIMKIRPNLFESSTRTPDPDLGTATNAYDALHTWQNQVGTQIAGDAATFGTVLGVSAIQFLQLGIWVLYILAILFIFASSQAGEAIFVMILCAPVLLIGLHFRLIEAYVVAVLAAVAVFVFVIKMWFTK
jgi:hypothetical protein